MLSLSLRVHSYMQMQWRKWVNFKSLQVWKKFNKSLHLHTYMHDSTHLIGGKHLQAEHNQPIYFTSFDHYIYKLCTYMAVYNIADQVHFPPTIATIPSTNLYGYSYVRIQDTQLLAMYTEYIYSQQLCICTILNPCTYFYYRYLQYS